MNLREIELEFYSCLRELRDLITSAHVQDAFLERLSEGLERIKTRRYTVAVIGEFKRGKSTLINALLGVPILPADVLPTTAAINRVTYGTNPRVQVLFKDGSRKELTDWLELSQHVATNANQNRTLVQSVREAVIEYPLLICQNHVDIIDTPGLNDNEEMTRVTLGMIDHIDAVVVTLSALSPFGQTERQLVSQLIAKTNITHIIFAVSFFDKIEPEDRERLKDYLRRHIPALALEHVKQQYPEDRTTLEKAQRLLGATVPIFFVSAHLALKSYETNNREHIEQSGFLTFRESLYTIVTAQQVINATQKSFLLLEQGEELLARGKADLEQKLRLKASDSERVIRYRTGSAGAVNALLVSHVEGVNPVRFDHDGLLRETVQCFVQALTKVTSCTHDAVREAILEGARLAGARAQTDLDALSGRLRERINAAASLYNERRRTELLMNDTSFLTLVRDQVANVSSPLFSWSCSVIPNVADLTACNVIVHIRKAAELSVQNAGRAFDSYARLLRVAFFNSARLEGELLPAKDQALEDIRREMEKGLLDVEREYQPKICAAKALVQQGRALLEELATK